MSHIKYVKILTCTSCSFALCNGTNGILPKVKTHKYLTNVFDPMSAHQSTKRTTNSNVQARSNSSKVQPITLTPCPRSNKALADSLDRAVDPRDPLVNRLLRVMATMAMSNALYFSTGACPVDQYYHYGN